MPAVHTVELLDEALAVARSLGYRIRQEWLDGGGGACQFGGQQWLFVDLSLSSIEQLHQVLEALEEDPRVSENKLSTRLFQVMQIRRAA